MTEFRYKAFISYSHEDRALAEWIHRGLESYRVPRRLVGTDGEHGRIDSRLRPVFMDRQDLGAAHSLDHELRQALEASEFLIVLCSPAAVRSRWIDEEIRLFAEMGRWHKVLAVVIEGDPEVRDGPTACFPRALYQDPEGREHEPLASDLRAGADGRRLGLQKLIAGLLGVPLDVLRRREHQRTVRRRVLLTAAAVALGAVGLFSLFSWNESSQRRDSGETLVAMKLNELRTVLDVKEDPESLPRLVGFDEAERRWARETVAQAQDGAPEAERLMEDGGIPAWESGDLGTAMTQFRRAWLLSALALQADPDDQEAFFQLGQAEFWIGQVHFDRAEWDDAERAFTAYAEITRRLVQSESDNPEWVLEMAYALSNLGSLEIERGGDPERILQIMQSALEYNQIALVLDPGNSMYEGELGQSLANLASAQLEVCDLDGALATTEASVEHELTLFEKRGAGDSHHWNLAAALGKRAGVHTILGHSDEATRDLLHSLDLLEALSSEYPEDMEVRMLVRDRRARLLRARGISGDLQRATDEYALEIDSWQSELDGLADAGFRAQGDLISSQLTRAEFLAALDRRDEALRELRDARERLMDLRLSSTDNSVVSEQLVRASFLAWHLGELPQASAAGDFGGESGAGMERSCAGAMTQLRLALIQGKENTARDYSSFLSSQGLDDFSYRFICNNYSVCGDQ